MYTLAQLAAVITAHHRRVIAIGILVTIALGSGIHAVELETSHDELVGSTATSDDYDYVESNFRAGPENTTAAKLIVRREYHVVSIRDMREQLRFENRLLNDSRVAPTLATDHQPTGITNVIMFVAMQRANGKQPDEIDPLPNHRPSPQKQLQTLNELDRESVPDYESDAIKALNRNTVGPPGGVYAYVPKYYDSRYNRRAHGTVIYVYQRENLSNQELLASQRALREIADAEFRETPETDIRVYGRGIVNDELARSTTDSLLLVGPISLLCIIGLLLYAYRDILDVSLALGGVGLVLVWVFGFMGWAGIEFNQLFVAIPVFLMGLSIDYSLHMFMRYREERVGDPFSPQAVFLGEDPDSSIQPAMQGAISSVGSAFVLVTLTTVTGFGAGAISPTHAIREFGIIASVGIISALAIFGVFVPAVKLELERRLEQRGYDRRNRSFGVRQGRQKALLERCVQLAERAPWAVVGVALLLTAASLMGALTLNTEFDQAQFHVKDTPDWLQSVPEPFRPGQYSTHESLQFFRSNGFVSEENSVHILVRGDVTQPDTLERMHQGHRQAERSTATLEFGRSEVRRADMAAAPLGNGRGPVRVMQAVARENQSFNNTFAAADTDNNGIPDRNLTGVYDHLFAVNRQAAETVIHRDAGRYQALRLGVYINGSLPTQAVASEMESTASVIDGDGLQATATGQPMVRADVQQELFTTILRGFALTLIIVLVLLAVVYRVREQYATLGVVAMLPVLFAVAWILGTMAVLGLRFNILTALVTSFTIGLGIDYSIHISERYMYELDRLGSPGDALRTSVFGTGGALLGSAATTTGGFGVLAFSLLTPLQQFGVITAITVAYAFVGSVVILPSLLVLWTRHIY